MQNLKTQGLTKDNVKIHLACNNVFLSLSLGFYLKEHLSAINEADFIITDTLHVKQEYPHLPVCMIGDDLHIPCSVYEMFSQLHDFYSHVNVKQASVFQKDMKHLKQNEMKIMNIPKINDKPTPYNDKDSQSGAIIEAIKQQKLQEIMQNTDQALSTQIELLFNELSKKIYDTINQTKK